MIDEEVQLPARNVLFGMLLYELRAETGVYELVGVIHQYADGVNLDAATEFYDLGRIPKGCKVKAIND